jgi:hypothetical protein
MLIANIVSLKRMQEQLPREVRELSYERVLDGEEFEHTLQYMRNTVNRRCTQCKEPEKLDCAMHRHLPHYVRTCLVGKKTAKEMVECWYGVVARAPDNTLSAYDPDGLKLIVCNDVFYLGLDPSTFL